MTAILLIICAFFLLLIDNRLNKIYKLLKSRIPENQNAEKRSFLGI